jgi:hypothetical protein
VALLPVYARDILHAGPWALGLLRGAPAVGAALMAITLAWSPLRRHAGWTMLGSVAVYGLATVVFALSRDVALSFAALVVVGAADMVSVVVRQHTVQLATPDAMRGRVSAVNLVFISASNELGEFESGVTAESRGPADDSLPRRLGARGTVVLDEDTGLDLSDLEIDVDGGSLKIDGGLGKQLDTFKPTDLRLRISDGATFLKGFGQGPYFERLSAGLTLSGKLDRPDDVAAHETR